MGALVMAAMVAAVDIAALPVRAPAAPPLGPAFAVSVQTVEVGDGRALGDDGPARHVDVGDRHGADVLDRGARALEGHEQEAVAVDDEGVVGHVGGGHEPGPAVEGGSDGDGHEALAGEGGTEGRRRGVAGAVEASEQAGRRLDLDHRRGGDGPAVLLGDEGEVEQRRAPAAVGLVDRHGNDAELLELVPQGLVEAERLGGAHPLRGGVAAVQAGEGLDELLLLVGRSEVHRRGRVSPTPAAASRP